MLPLVPQLVFLDGKFQIHGDFAEMEAIGKETFQKLLIERAHASLENKEGIRFFNQQVEVEALDDSVAYPPRAFAKNLRALQNGDQR